MTMEEVLILAFAVTAVYAALRCMFISDKMTELTGDLWWMELAMGIVVLALGTFTIGSTIAWIILEIVYKRTKKKLNKAR